LAECVYGSSKICISLENYFFISDAEINLEEVELDGLNPADPLTYTQEKRKDLNLSSFPSFNVGSNSWLPGHKAETSLKIESSKDTTQTHKAKVKISFELSEFFELAVEGSFEYSLTTSMRTENEIKCTTALNPPHESTDLDKLNYQIYWIKPYDGGNNWWLHEGAKNQKTWCVTYLVTSLKRKDGTGIGSFSVSTDGEIPGGGTGISSFTVNDTKAGVVLKWQTSKEENNFGFNVERRSDIGDWEMIGFVEGSGTSDSPKDYSFTDANPILGLSNYRLNQIDINNKSEYSEVLEIVVEQQLPTVFSLLQNYPNPFNPTTNISFTVPSNAHTTLKIFNSLGQEIATLFNGEAQTGIINNVQFNARDLSSGLYFSRLECEGKIQLKKMLLIK